MNIQSTQSPFKMLVFNLTFDVLILLAKLRKPKHLLYNKWVALYEKKYQFLSRFQNIFVL